MTIANGITLFRLALVPVFLYFFIAGEKGWTFAIFCIAGGSDLIDGTVARLLKQRSSWGAVLDPIADKILLESAFVCLVIGGVLPLWFFLLAFSRDLTILLGILYFRRKRIAIPPRPSWTSKFATAVQIITIVIGLAELWRPDLIVGGMPLHTALIYSMFGATVLIAASGLLYVRMGLSIAQRHKRLLAVQE